MDILNTLGNVVFTSAATVLKDALIEALSKKADLRGANLSQMTAGGEGIHWPDLDEDISVESLLAGRRSGGQAADRRGSRPR